MERGAEKLFSDLARVAQMPGGSHGAMVSTATDTSGNSRRGRFGHGEGGVAVGRDLAEGGFWRFDGVVGDVDAYCMDSFE